MDGLGVDQAIDTPKYWTTVCVPGLILTCTGEKSQVLEIVPEALCESVYSFPESPDGAPQAKSSIASPNAQNHIHC